MNPGDHWHDDTSASPRESPYLRARIPRILLPNCEVQRPKEPTMFMTTVELPVDILLAIFGYLTPNDILIVRQVRAFQYGAVFYLFAAFGTVSCNLMCLRKIYFPGVAFSAELDFRVPNAHNRGLAFYRPKFSHRLSSVSLEQRLPVAYLLDYGHSTDGTSPLPPPMLGSSNAFPYMRRASRTPANWKHGCD